MQITSSGIGSGLDVDGLVSQLVAAERSPAENRLNAEEFQLQSELSGYGTLKSALSTFQTAMGQVKQLSTFQQRSVTSSDDSAISVTPTSGNALGQFSIQAQSLATSHSLASTAFTSLDSVVGEGTLTFRFGTTDYDPGGDTYNSFTLNSSSESADVVIDSSNNTLQGVRDAINASGAPVTAAIVNDGSGYRLLVSATSTGAENSIEVTVADSDLNDTDTNGLSVLTFNSSATAMEQTVVAADAVVIINGLSVSSASNTVTEAIDGLSIDLKATTTTAVDVAVTRDKDSVRSAIESMVNGYRAFNAVANQLSAFDADSQRGAVLLGDSTLRTTAARLRQVLNEPVDNVSGTFATLSEIGVTTDANGSLNIDETRLNELLDNNFDELASLFAPVATMADADITFIGATGQTLPGDYEINITQLATQGQVTGAAVLPDFGGGGTVTIDGNNDNLTLALNGVNGGTLTLTHGVYTSGAALATEIQTRINTLEAFQETGATVAVDYSAGSNTLSIRSTIFGSDSTIELTNTDASSAATLGLSIDAGTAGLDVEGDLGGQAFVGQGQVFTGPEGSPSEGLSLSVTGGVTGARGTVAFSQGIAERLDVVISGMLDNDGLLDARTEGINSSIESIASARSALDLRLESYELRLRNQFTALDSLVAQLQGTGSFLTSALSSLPSNNA